MRAVDEEAGFIAAMLADPADRTVLLVYADWLDERSDPRGKYLRLVAKGLVRDGVIDDIDLPWFIQLTSRIDPVWRALVETRHWRVGDGVLPLPHWGIPWGARVAAISPDRSTAEVAFTTAGVDHRREVPLRIL